MNNDRNMNTPLSDDGLKSVAGSVASDIRNAASNKYDEAVSEVRARADGAKSDVAGEVKDVAAALRRASEEMRGGSAQERTLGQISSSLADAADQIRDKDFGEMIEIASKVARNNPMLFVGGAALLGFAASRFAKASGDHTGKPGDSRYSDKNAQVNTYVDEGNPNAQPMPTVPS